MQLLKVFSLVWAVSALVACGETVATRSEGVAGSQDGRPNVLFIMSDQHSARALGCYGNPQVRTPRLDRLAREGVRFENAFCQAGQCCPSRYSIWTGRYPHSHGLRWNGVAEPLDEITVGEVFQQAGYVTGTIGKHHMQHSPVRHGFQLVLDEKDYAAWVKKQGIPHCWAAGDWLDLDRRATAGPAGTSRADNDHHMAGFWANRAIAFLQDHADRPFCLWLSFHGPHVPWVASKQWMDLYDPDELMLPPNFHDSRKRIPPGLARLRALFAGFQESQFRQILRCYYALVSQIDFNVGRVLDELDRLGLAGRTIVVYTADHGEMMGEHGVFRKAVLNYDATVRVPLVIRYPARVPAGKVSEQLVGSIDLMPTLCDLAGLKIPDKVQGRSLVPLLEGKSVPWREVIFSEIGYPAPSFAQGMSVMARTRDFKYVRHTCRGRTLEELFDLKADPWETVNLAGDPKHADTLKRLRQAIEQWNTTTDRAPLYPIGDGS